MFRVKWYIVIDELMVKLNEEKGYTKIMFCLYILL